VASDEWLESWRFATRAAIGSAAEATQVKEAEEAGEAQEAEDGAARRLRRRLGGAKCMCISASTLALWDGEETCTEVQNGCKRNSVGSSARAVNCAACCAPRCSASILLAVFPAFVAPSCVPDGSAGLVANRTRNTPWAWVLNETSHQGMNQNWRSSAGGRVVPRVRDDVFSSVKAHVIGIIGNARMRPLNMLLKRPTFPAI
jgi:hypothetical protein